MVAFILTVCVIFFVEAFFQSKEALDGNLAVANSIAFLVRLFFIVWGLVLVL